MAGKRERGWGEVRAYSDCEQRTDDLFNDYIRLVRDLRPRSFVAENVSGLVRGKAFGVFRQIMLDLRVIGYRVDARMIQAEWLGVPQARHRLFVVGVRSDLGKDPVFPRPLRSVVSISDACPWITNSSDDTERVDLPDHDLASVDSRRYAIAKKWRSLGIGESDFSTIRADARQPVATLTTKACDPTSYGVMHPSVCRKFTPAEIRRLSGFPDDFRLTGTTKQKGERIGRAVAPPVTRAIGACILRQLGR
jgi:DNA (cytosine-5)-methyltransferase 1